MNDGDMQARTMSVVIPTRHRPDILRRCLEHLARQTIVSQLEIMVIHDGTDDADTATLIEQVNASSLLPHPVRYYSIPKSQQGVARNYGVRLASTSTILFIGDDAFLEPDACEHHLSVHQRHGACAVLGYVEWDPACGITPVMRWMDKTGWQFAYQSLEPFAQAFLPLDQQHRYSYTIHLSVPTHIARAMPFREDLPLYGWEDVLWGKELAHYGIGLYYESHARALHHHSMTLADSLRRMETIGESLAIIRRMDPTFERYPHLGKRLVYRVRSVTPTMRGRHDRAFLRGLRKGRVSARTIAAKRARQAPPAMHAPTTEL